MPQTTEATIKSITRSEHSVIVDAILTGPKFRERRSFVYYPPFSADIQALVKADIVKWLSDYVAADQAKDSLASLVNVVFTPESVATEAAAANPEVV